MFRNILAAALLIFPTLAHADWYEASSKHFIVYADDDPEKLKSYTERLERFDGALRYITGTPDKPQSPQARVKVFVVDDVRAVQEIYGGRGPAGFMNSRASGSFAVVPRGSGGGDLDAQAILFHEYGHNFMFSTWPSAVFPPWFVEGFAEFVGTAVFRSDGAVLIGAHPSYRGFGMLDSATVPARRLLSLNPGKLRDMEAQTFYGRGWLLTHYSLLGGHAEQFVNYITAVNAGKLDEANNAFGDYDKLDSQLNAYAARKRIPVIPLTKQQTPIGEVKLRKLSAGEAATMPALIRSTRGVDDKLAPEIAALARRLAAPYPNDAAAQNELAEAEYDADNFAAAEAAADRALAADPDSIHALMYKGMAQMEMAKEAKVTDAAKWKAIRNWFLKANRLDTQYAWPMLTYYRSFDVANEPPSNNARTALLGAYSLAPFDLGLRIEAGKVLLQQKDIVGARVAFEPVAYGPHSGSLGTMADNVLAALDKDGADAALKVIADAEAKAKKDAEEAKKKKEG